MKKTLRFYLFNVFTVFFLVVFFTSCTKESKETAGDKEPGAGEVYSSKGGSSGGKVEFWIEYPQPREIFRMDREDLNNNGNDEIIVLSAVKDDEEQKYFDFYNFDLIQVFALDSTWQNYEKILTDTVDYSVDCEYVDLQNNGKKQIIVKTNTGGNDVYASAGMFIYDMTSEESIELLKFIEMGNPEIKDIDADGKKEILVTDSFWGILPSIDVIYFVRDIYRMEGGAIQRRNGEYQEFFEERVNKAKEGYGKEKSVITAGGKISASEYPLYGNAVRIAVNYWSKEDGKNLLVFWDGEKDFLKKSLPEDQYVDLENFILRVIPLVQKV